MILNDLPNSEIRKYIHEFLPFGPSPFVYLLEDYIIDGVPARELVYDRKGLKDFQILIKKFKEYVEGRKNETLQSND